MASCTEYNTIKSGDVTPVVIPAAASITNLTGCITCERNGTIMGAVVHPTTPPIVCNGCRSNLISDLKIATACVKCGDYMCTNCSGSQVCMDPFAFNIDTKEPLRMCRICIFDIGVVSEEYWKKATEELLKTHPLYKDKQSHIAVGEIINKVCPLVAWEKIKDKTSKYYDGVATEDDVLNEIIEDGNARTAV
jgi:hypothetical protein